ncbi:MAG TPA: glycosyltransferase [Sphingomicrobium sp.]|nr:glycosyltransferase [Sphingomicrobium sp.]
MIAKFRRETAGDHIALLLPNMGGGGAERVALTLIDHFVARGYSVDLVLMRAEGELLPLVPAEVQIVDLAVKRVRGLVGPLAAYLERAKPGAMQVSMWPLTVAAIVARAIQRSPTRIVISDHAALSKEYGDKGFWHRQLLRWSMRLFYPKAEARVVVAADTAKDLARLSGLPERSFEVIYNPVAPPSETAEGPAGEQLWNGSGRRILNVGRMNSQKNQRLLLDAFARLVQRCDARLIILGDGVLRSELERQAQDLGIAHRVEMPGFQLNLGSYYRSADLFVLSSDFEGYPLVLIEALHCGLPIVSTDCLSGPAEILDHGEFGRLVPCGDSARLAEAMVEALQLPANPERLRQRAAELTANATDRYLELIVGNGKPA